MQNVVVTIPSIRRPISPSPGFTKKDLADFKLDIMGLCEFGCRYCSSNNGNYLRINRAQFGAVTKEQTGQDLSPAKNPQLTFHWPDILPKLTHQLTSVGQDWGRGKTLVFSMLTDGFSPSLVADGTTRRALELVLEHSSFRIRILTKNAVIGEPEWIEFFRSHPDRFVVGLSTGTLDDGWARRVELGTSSPTARLAALRKLQAAGIPTYGMMCPIFPDMTDRDRLAELLAAIDTDAVEHVWAEPFNDRQNWEQVRSGYVAGSAGHAWLTKVYERGDSAEWSRYAVELYQRLREHAERGGWLKKLRYLLYEAGIQPADMPRFQDCAGILFQSRKAESAKAVKAGSLP